MKAEDIKVGGFYQAKISGRIVTVRVDEIDDEALKGLRRNYLNRTVVKRGTAYHVTNMLTGRKTSFRSAAKFRRVAKKPAEPEKTIAKPEQKGTGLVGRIISVGELGVLFVQITGRTYPNREQLRAAGASWDDKHKCWSQGTNMLHKLEGLLDNFDEIKADLASRKPKSLSNAQ